MSDYLIHEYVKKLNINDVLNYAKKENIALSEYEALIILSYAKKHLDTFIKGNPSSLFKELKNKLSTETYKSLYKLYIEAKIKYLK